MTRCVKICGLTRAEDVETSIRHGVDMLGFIIEAKSKRRLTVSQAAQLARPAKNIVPIIAVTVNPDDQLIADIMAHMRPDYIQLHGDESPAHLEDIRAQYKVKLIKAVPVTHQNDMNDALDYNSAADLILYDAKPPKGSDVRGGHGLAIDWSLFEGAALPKTYLLAGGLTPDNVTQAATMTNAPIVDVSSGVEAAAGVKDHAKIKAFIKAVKHG